jgi:hypothetical protein
LSILTLLECRGLQSTVTTTNAVEDDSQHQTTIERHSCEDMSLVGCGNYIAFDIPSFYEESLNSSSLSTSSNGEEIPQRPIGLLLIF